MTTSNPSPNSALSCLDGVAAVAPDVWLLIGRILLCWTFLAVGWGQVNNLSGSIAYFNLVKAPMPDLFVWLALAAEAFISVTLILGVATRYGAVVAIVFLAVAIALAHRYWEYPPAQVVAQYNNFLKNLSMIGGMLYIFVFGPGRFSVDAMLGKK